MRPITRPFRIAFVLVTAALALAASARAQHRDVVYEEAWGAAFQPGVWDCGGPKGPEGTQPQMLEGPEDTVTAVAFQRRGYLAAATARDGRVVLWQPANKKAPKVGEHRFKDAEAAALAWSPDDKALAVGAGDGTVAVFRVG